MAATFSQYLMEIRILTPSFVAFLLFFASLGLAQGQTIRYVKPTATGTGDGLSWTNASGNLQAMITASAANDQV